MNFLCVFPMETLTVVFPMKNLTVVFPKSTVNIQYHAHPNNNETRDLAVRMAVCECENGKFPRDIVDTVVHPISPRIHIRSVKRIGNEGANFIISSILTCPCTPYDSRLQTIYFKCFGRILPSEPLGRPASRCSRVNVSSVPRISPRHCPSQTLTTTHLTVWFLCVSGPPAHHLRARGLESPKFSEDGN